MILLRVVVSLTEELWLLQSVGAAGPHFGPLTLQSRKEPPAFAGPLTSPLPPLATQQQVLTPPLLPRQGQAQGEHRQDAEGPST